MSYAAYVEEKRLQWERAPLLRSGQYGAQKPQQKDTRWVTSINLAFVMIGVLVPWGLFVANYAAMCFYSHYYGSGVWAWIIFSLFTFATAIFGAMGLVSCITESRNPTWFFLLCGMMIVALVGSTYFGHWNYRENLLPYYDLKDLNSYQDVDPATSSGLQVMDAAMITFKKDVAPNVAGAISFRSRYTYCAAPLTASNDTSLTSGEYNFWAVGIDCCSKARGDFHCGATGNAQAHSGLRLIADVGFYRLAVQQAEAAYQINAPKPVFLAWTEDPVNELETWHTSGVRYYVFGIVVHLGVQALFCALITLGILYKLL